MCGAKRPRTDLKLGIRTMLMYVYGRVSSVFLHVCLLFFNYGHFNTHKNSVTGTPNAFFVCICRSFSPKRRTIKWLKLPFSHRPHSVAWHGRMLLPPFVPFDFEFVFPLHKSVSDIIKSQWCLQPGSKYFGNLFFSGPSAVYSVVRLNRSELWFVGPIADSPWSNFTSAYPRLIFYFHLKF